MDLLLCVALLMQYIGIVGAREVLYTHTLTLTLNVFTGKPNRERRWTANRHKELKCLQTICVILLRMIYVCLSAMCVCWLCPCGIIACGVMLLPFGIPL